MFRTVFPSIIRSSKLHIWQQAYVKQLLPPAAIGDEMEHLVPDSSRWQQLFGLPHVAICAVLSS
jgi:hypothetical protein